MAPSLVLEINGNIIRESENHRITKVGKDLKDHQVQPSNSSALTGMGPVLRPQNCGFYICYLINATVNIVGLESVPPLLLSW